MGNCQQKLWKITKIILAKINKKWKSSEKNCGKLSKYKIVDKYQQQNGGKWNGQEISIKNRRKTEKY